MTSDYQPFRRTLIMGFFAVITSVSTSQNSWAQDPGEQVFNTTCFACHTIGGGRLIGPDLAGVHEKRSQEWLENFVKSSQSVIKAGDPEAVAIFEEYSGMMMPDAAASDEQIRQVLSYISAQSLLAQGSVDVPSADIAATDLATPVEPALEEDILAGQDLFQGSLRLVNGVAAELTTVFSRMGGAGVTAILGRAPFPVMQTAYVEHPLTEYEVTALVAFLEFADSEQYNQLPRDYGLGLFASGVVGAGILFGLFGFVWRGRKIGSVNQSIYDRQIKSSLDDTV